MSYCRWSTDDFRCDLYCYEDVSGGWTTHVASWRHVGDRPHVDFDLLSSMEDRAAAPAEYMVQHRALSDWLKTADHEPIGLPYDGKTFRDPTLEDFKATLVMLKEAGYCFPASVIEAVDEEIAERDAT